MRFDVAEDGWAELNPDYPDNPVLRIHESRDSLAALGRTRRR
jgi:hypothetical protein